MGAPPSVADRLAVQRTMLANERTLLAYARTAIAFVAAGASAVHFLTGLAPHVLGWALIAAGVITQAIGLRRFQRVRAVLRASAPPPEAVARS